MLHIRGRVVGAAVRVALLGALGAASLLRPTAAHAQLGSVAGLVIPGGYVLVNDSARDALGSPKFYREAQMFGSGIPLGLGQISFGVKIINATSNITPFSGANQFTLVGPSVEVSTTRVGGFRPFASVGLFASNIRSDRLDINEWDFTPSVAAGLDVPLAPAIGLRAEYRMSERVSGLDIDGFALSLQLFR